MKLFVMLFGILASINAHAVLPAGSSVSFKGSAALAQVKAGTVTSSLRLKDRTQAPYSYVVGKVLPLVNSDTTEERRSEEEQIAANAYGFLSLTQISVSQVSALSPSEQAELHQYYTQDRIDEAKGVITKITFKFKASN